jgi:hypothetical protein
MMRRTYRAAAPAAAAASLNARERWRRWCSQGLRAFAISPTPPGAARAGRARAAPRRRCLFLSSRLRPADPAAAVTAPTFAPVSSFFLRSIRTHGHIAKKKAVVCRPEFVKVRVLGISHLVVKGLLLCVTTPRRVGVWSHSVRHRTLPAREAICEALAAVRR